MINISDSSLGTLTSSFGLRAQPTAGASTNHKGIDVVLKNNMIPAVQAGTVTESAYSTSRGYYVTVQHEDGTSTRYQHLQSSAPVRVGQSVAEGETIGLQGSSGVSTGTHLHFEVFDSEGEYLDPVEYLAGGVSSYNAATGLKEEGYLEGKVNDALSVVVKFVSYLVLAALAAFLFFKAFDIKIPI